MNIWWGVCLVISLWIVTTLSIALLYRKWHLLPVKNPKIERKFCNRISKSSVAKLRQKVPRNPLDISESFFLSFSNIHDWGGNKKILTKNHELCSILVYAQVYLGLSRFTQVYTGWFTPHRSLVDIKQKCWNKEKYMVFEDFARKYTNPP